MKLTLISLFLLLYTFLTPFLAEGSIIEIAQNAREAVVDVYAKTSQTEGQTGAGIIIDPSGIIVTNFHTINQAETIIIELHNKKRISAQILALESKYDLALLKVTPPFTLSSIPIGDSNTLTFDSRLIHIGNSLYLNDTISEGRVIGLGKSKSNPNPINPIEMIQTNIILYDGDSGGPLLNLNGELIGLIHSKLRDPKNQSFAIPSNKIKNLYEDQINSHIIQSN